MELPDGSAATRPATQTDPDGIDGKNFALAAGAGLGAALGGAIIWAIVTVATNYELGVMAVAVGFIVGKGVAALANSRNKAYGVLGAVCSLIGCLLGNLLSAVGFFARANEISYFSALRELDVPLVVRLMTVTFSPMDILFYAIGIYEGYRFSLAR